jgi:uncharacterized membrane protein YidH (DUF202 family)
MVEAPRREGGWRVVGGEVVDARVLVGQDVHEHLEGRVQDDELCELASERELAWIRTPHASLFFGTGLGFAACEKVSK